MLEESLSRLLSLRQYRQDGVRRPSKPLLVLLVLGRLRATGSSAVTWDEVEKPLAELIAEFGPPSRTAARQSAAYPFTHLRTDGVWSLNRDVPMDNIGPLDESPITGRLAASLERALSEPGQLEMAARMIVESQFPTTVAPDVLTAVGLDPETVLSGLRAEVLTDTDSRRRSSSWPAAILAAWDHQCAFCRYDGRLGKSVVGIEAAHVRWFNLGGPDASTTAWLCAPCTTSYSTVERWDSLTATSSSSPPLTQPAPTWGSASTNSTAGLWIRDRGGPFPALNT